MNTITIPLVVRSSFEVNKVTNVGSGSKRLSPYQIHPGTYKVYISRISEPDTTLSGIIVRFIEITNKNESILAPLSYLLHLNKRKRRGGKSPFTEKSIQPAIDFMNKESFSINKSSVKVPSYVQKRLSL